LCAIALGEGIDKQESDFAAEVAAASGQKITAGRVLPAWLLEAAGRLKESDRITG